MKIEKNHRKETWDWLTKENQDMQGKRTRWYYTEFALRGYFWSLHSTYLVGIPIIHTGLGQKDSASSEVEHSCYYKWFLYVDVVTVVTGTFSRGRLTK